MTSRVRMVSVGVVALGLVSSAGGRGLAAQSPPPPEAPRSDFTAVHHGVEVPDPYRWMEDADHPDLVAWIQAQDRYARAWIAEGADLDSLRTRIRTGADHWTFTSPIPRAGRTFYTRRNASGTRVEILVREDGHDRVLVGTEEMRAEGGTIDLRVWPSRDGRLLAYGVSPAGSRWMELRFRDVATGRDLPDRLQGLQGRRISNVSWAVDGSGVWYDRFDLPREGQATAAALAGSRLVHHRLGTDPVEDIVVLRARVADGLITHEATDDGAWLVVRENDGVGYDDRVLAIEARPSSEASRTVTLVDDPGATFTLVGSRGSELWLYTTLDAARGRIVGIDVDDPAPAAWRDVVPERAVPVDTWTGARAVGHAIVVGYREQGLLRMRVFRPDLGDREGTELRLPRLGSIWFGVTGVQGDSAFYYTLSSFADPGTVYRHDLTTDAASIFVAPELPYDPADFVTTRVFWDGPAGDSIPMFLAHHRDVEPDGSHPVMMYGYAFGGWPASPWFRAHMGEWFRMGGVFALPALRGGGEFGTDWARAGLGVQRQNAVDDYVAAARWLVRAGLARPERLVAETNSAGASVVGAAIVQAPELFGAAILGFPLLDVLRYEEFSVGRQWRSQLGSVENEAEFHALLGYSPLRNVEPERCYPPTLVTPGERDETTPPLHAYKFVATLQATEGCIEPALLRVSWGAGHTYGRDQETTIENFADQLAFLTRTLTAWTPDRR